MSHEIRTPMNGVIGMVEVLHHSHLPEQHAHAVRAVRTSAFMLLGIIDNILDFSKIEAGRMELERAQVALPELIEGVCATLLPIAKEKDVEIELFISPLLTPQIWSIRSGSARSSSISPATPSSSAPARAAGAAASRSEPR